MNITCYSVKIIAYTQKIVLYIDIVIYIFRENIERQIINADYKFDQEENNLYDLYVLKI